MASETTTRRRSSTDERLSQVLSNLNPLNMPLRYQLGLVGLAGFLLVPVNLFPDELGPFIRLMYLMMFAMSWDVVSGYTGQLSFGHAFFFALGGYSSVILNTQHGLSPALSIPIAMVVAAIGGVVVGLPALRLRGPYLSLVTLIVPVIMAKLFILFNDGLTPFGIPLAPEGLGGRSGLAIPDPIISTSPQAVVSVDTSQLFGQWFSGFQLSMLGEYYISFVLFLVILIVLLAVTRSSAGEVFTAIRESEDAVESVGLNPAKFKLFAFVLSGAVGGLAGAAFVHTSVAIAQPAALLGTANIQMSINVIVMTILGGLGTIVGAAVGGILFGGTQWIIENFVTFTIPVIEMTGEDLKPLPLLAIAMAALVFAPGGAVRENIELGREVLATIRGEEVGGEEPMDNPVGDIVANYREELDDITGDDGGDDR